MKKIITTFYLACMAMAASAVEPIYVQHNKVRGTTPVMTNMQAWAASIGTGGGGLTTNDVNAIIASSNLCTVTAAQAMTNGLFNLAGGAQNMDYSVSLTYGERGAPAHENVVSYGRTFGETRFGSIFGTDTSEFNGKAALAGFSDVAYSMYDESFMHSIVIDSDTGRWKADGNQIAYTSEIKTKTSDLTNDSGFIETFEVSTGWRGVRTNVSFVASANAMNGFKVYGSDFEVQEGDLIIHDGWTSLMANGEDYQTQTLPDYLAGGGWNTAEGSAKFATLGDIGGGGLTTNDVNAIIASSNLCTVAAAQAMTNGLFNLAGGAQNMDYSVSLTYAPPGASTGENIVKYGATFGGTKFGSIFGNDESEFNGKAVLAGFSDVAYSMYDESFMHSIVIDSDTGRWKADGNQIAYTSEIKTLTGHTYDFHDGSNFTKNLYTALTNVIQTLGGTVTNPPTFN